MTTPDSKDRYISHTNLEIAAEVAIQLDRRREAAQQRGHGFGLDLNEGQRLSLIHI